MVSLDISVNDLASDFVKSSIDIRLKSTNFVRSILKHSPVLSLKIFQVSQKLSTLDLVTQFSDEALLVPRLHYLKHTGCTFDTPLKDGLVLRSRFVRGSINEVHCLFSHLRDLLLRKHQISLCQSWTTFTCHKVVFALLRGIAQVKVRLVLVAGFCCLALELLFGWTFNLESKGFDIALRVNSLLQ